MGCLWHLLTRVIFDGTYRIAQTVVHIGVLGPSRSHAPVQASPLLVQTQFKTTASGVTRIFIEAVTHFGGVGHDGVFAAELVKRRVDTDARCQQSPPAELDVVVSGRIQFRDGRAAIKLTHLRRCEAHAQVAVKAAAGTERIGGAQLRAEFAEMSNFVGRTKVSPRRQVVLEVVTNAVIAPTCNHPNFVTGAEFQLRKCRIVGNAHAIVANAIGVVDAVQAVTDVAASGHIAHDGQVVRDKVVLTSVDVNTRHQPGTQCVQRLGVFDVHPQRLNVVVVDRAPASGPLASGDRVIGQLAMVVVARKESDRRQTTTAGFTFPGHMGARGFVFAPCEGVDALAGVRAKVIFKQTARCVGVQVRVHQGSPHP